MGISKRGNSKFWYVQFQLNGHTFIRSTKTTDRRLAEQFETEWRRRLIEQQVLGVCERITVGAAVDLYLDAKAKLASIRSLRHYGRMVAGFLGPNRWVDDIRSAEFERFKAEFEGRGYSGQSIKHLVNVARGSWKHVKRLGYRVGAVEFPSVKVGKGRLRYLSYEEEKRLLDAVNPAREVKGLAPLDERTDTLKNGMQDVRDFFVLLLDTGARFSELAGLKWRSISLNERTISLWRPKVRNESILYMTDRVHQTLHRRYQARTGEYVFSNRSGGPRSYVAGTFKRAFKRAGLSDCSAHTLRHTHATRLIQNGLNIYEVKEILGHSDIKTTMRYAHLEQRSISAKASDVIDRLTKTQIGSG